MTVNGRPRQPDGPCSVEAETARLVRRRTGISANGGVLVLERTADGVGPRCGQVEVQAGHPGSRSGRPIARVPVAGPRPGSGRERVRRGQARASMPGTWTRVSGGRRRFTCPGRGFYRQGQRQLGHELQRGNQAPATGELPAAQPGDGMQRVGPPPRDQREQEPVVPVWMLCRCWLLRCPTLRCPLGVSAGGDAPSAAAGVVTRGFRWGLRRHVARKDAARRHCRRVAGQRAGRIGNRGRGVQKRRINAESAIGVGIAGVRNCRFRTWRCGDRDCRFLYLVLRGPGLPGRAGERQGPPRARLRAA